MNHLNDGMCPNVSTKRDSVEKRIIRDKKESKRGMLYKMKYDNKKKKAREEKKEIKKRERK